MDSLGQVDSPAMAADRLLQAEALAEEFCQQLRLLLEQARQRQHALEIDARQAHRFLDELEVRLRLAQAGTSLAPADPNHLRKERDALLAQEQQTRDALGSAEESSRRLELLLRQVEMSSHSLRREVHIRPYDPWELALRSQVLHGREQERSALAREAHDGPAQVLSNLILGLERFRQVLPQRDGEAVDLAEKLLRDARLGLKEVRRFIYDLRPSPVAEESLGQQVERYVRDLETVYQVNVELHWGTPQRDLSREETIAIYRIVQEALRNAQKHARAERIAVDAYWEPTGWTVRVADEGVGFDPNAAWDQEDHWGVVGMRERARLIGADLEIKSRPGEGTKVLLRLPILPEDRTEERS